MSTSTPRPRWSGVAGSAAATVTRYGFVAAFALLIAFFSVASDAFLRPSNLLNVLDGVAILALVALALTVVVGVLTVVPGRATRLQGGVHLVLLAAFVFLSINP